MANNEENHSFIQSRLEALDAIDSNIVNLLDNLGDLFTTYIEPNTHEAVELHTTKEQFIEKTRNVYSLLGSIAVGLRKEVKIMDENIGVFDKNDERVMILPISVERNHTTLGSAKLKQEIAKMDHEVPDNA